MLFLIIGLLLFLIPHSVAIFAPQWRKEKMSSVGPAAYAGVYSVLSLIGLGLIVWGYGQSRLDPVFIWTPPAAMNHLASLLVLVAFIVITAAYVPNNHLKAAIGHPMVLSVKIWAFAHLLANGRLGDIVLFGAFMVWAIMLFIALKKADRQSPPAQMTPLLSRTLATVVIGIIAWMAFAMWLHIRLIGVAPFAVAGS